MTVPPPRKFSAIKISKEVTPLNKPTSLRKFRLFKEKLRM